MFDDHVSQQGGTPPANLPFGEPEDIFSHVDDAPASSPSQSGMQADPPFDNISAPAPASALSAGVLQRAPMSAPTEEVPIPPTPSAPAPPVVAPPAMQAAAAPSPVPTTPVEQLHTMPTDAPEMYALKEPKTSRGIITIIIALVVIVILGGGGALLYQRFVVGNATSVQPASFLEATTPVVVDTTDTEEVDVPYALSTTPSVPAEQVEDVTLEQDILFGDIVDTDADGLDDERELTIGTDPAHWDTDGDELSDGDEVIIWKTDPLNPDTDGDGYTDGSEIKNGYSPTGPGKIFEPPTELTPETQNTP